MAVCYSEGGGLLFEVPMAIFRSVVGHKSLYKKLIDEGLMKRDWELIQKKNPSLWQL